MNKNNCIDNIKNLNLKEFSLFSTYNYELNIFHSEIIRIYQILKSNNSKSLAKKFKIWLYMIDKMNNTKTEIEENTFRGDIEKVALSGDKYIRRKYNRENLLKKVESFYNGK